MTKIIHNMTNIGFNIRKIREEKGLSQEYVAHELGINQSTYGKLERENCKISVDRLYKIAEILNEDITKILNINSKNTFNQTNQHHGYGYVETLHVENKEIYEQLVKQLKEENMFLKELLNKK